MSGFYYQLEGDTEEYPYAIQQVLSLRLKKKGDQDIEALKKGITAHLESIAKSRKEFTEKPLPDRKASKLSSQLNKVYIQGLEHLSLEVQVVVLRGLVETLFQEKASPLGDVLSDNFSIACFASSGDSKASAPTFPAQTAARQCLLEMQKVEEVAGRNPFVIVIAKWLNEAASSNDRRLYYPRKHKEADGYYRSLMGTSLLKELTDYFDALDRDLVTKEGLGVAQFCYEGDNLRDVQLLLGDKKMA